MCDRRYVAIVGTKYHNGKNILKPSMCVRLKKECDNDYDQEAIEVSIDNFGKIGYVANSVKTVPKGCYSGGRIYDTFDDTISGIIRFVLDDTAIIELIDDNNSQMEMEMEFENEEELEKSFLFFTNILQNLFSE